MIDCDDGTKAIATRNKNIDKNGIILFLLIL